MSTWTFITNHAAVLGMIGNNKKITARELAAGIGITERAVLRIISELEAEEYIIKYREGRCLRYEIKLHLPLRHTTQRDKDVGELMKFLGSGGTPEANQD